MDHAALPSKTPGDGTSPSRIDLDLRFDRPDGPAWTTVDDVVMGGRSASTVDVVDGLLRFRGTLSLDDGGGFASARTRGAAFDLSGADAVLLRLRGDGRRYSLRLYPADRDDGGRVSYAGEVDTVAGTWTEARIGLADLVPTVRGRRLDGPPLDPATVDGLGLLLADRRAGPFALDVAWIRAG